MTTFDILNLQFGVTAIANYKRGPVQAAKSSVEPLLKNLYILQFNKDQDNYTVSFNEPRKRMKTEKMLTRLELLTMQGELPLSFPLCYS
jgi:hypothetical protein